MENREISRSALETKVIRRAWESHSFKQKLLNNPREALQEVGLDISEDVEITVVEEHRKKLVIVLPMNPLGSMKEFMVTPLPPPGTHNTVDCMSTKTIACSTINSCPISTISSCPLDTQSKCNITLHCPSFPPGPASPQKPNS